MPCHMAAWLVGRQLPLHAPTVVPLFIEKDDAALIFMTQW